MSSGAQNSNTTIEAPATLGTATIIERSCSDAVTEIETGAVNEAPADAARLIVGAEFFGCTLCEPIKVSSGEADLWVADRQGQRVVVKIYRWNIHPKAEIAGLVKQADRRHVVTLLNHGTLPDGRSVEVLEYISGGTLAELLPRAQTDESFRSEIVREVASAITAMHSVDLIHRDIKPSNILVRSEKPLDLAIADFGISSVTDLEIYKTSNHRTIRYSAPESTQGVVSKGVDWWALGVILLEICLGRHPFAGLDDLTVNLQLVSRPMPLPDDLPVQWRTLIAGLLTKDYQNRWKSEQVNRWLAGEKDIPVHFETAANLTAASSTAKPYPFEEKDYPDAPSLARALAKSPIEGAKQIERGLVREWLVKQLGEHGIASKLDDIKEDKKLKPADKFTLAVMLMGPDLPLFINGKVASPDSLANDLPVGIALVEGPIPDWLEKHRKDPQYLDIRKRRKDLHAALKQAGVAYDESLADRLAFSKTADVLAQAEKDRKSYARATVAALTAALKESPLRELTAGLLLAAERAQFISWQQHFDEVSGDLHKRLSNLGQLIDEAVTNESKLQAYLTEANKVEREFNKLSDSCGAHISIASKTTAAVKKLVDSCRTRAEARLREHTEHQQLLQMALQGEVVTVRSRLIHRPFSDIDYDKIEKAIQQWSDAIVEWQALIDKQMPKGPVVPKTSFFRSDVEFLKKQTALTDFLQKMAPKISEAEQTVGTQRGAEVFAESRLGVAKLRRSFDWLQDFAKAQERAQT